MSQPVTTIGRNYAIIAFIEATTWAGLLIGMFLKYVTDTTELGVQIFGQLHGIAFLVYVVIAIIAAIRLRWGPRVTLVALLVAIPPMATIPLEMWLRRTGRLAVPQTFSSDATAKPIRSSRAG